MSRNGDIYDLGPSELVPFIQGEDGAARHRRRLESAMANQDAIREFCQERGLRFQVKSGHFMVRGTNLYIQWWPASAKLVINEKWQHGVHCHDYQQLFKVIRRRMRENEASVPQMPG